MSDKAIEEAQAKYGQLVTVEVSGVVLAFRPMDRAKLTEINKRLKKSPDLSLEILTNAVEFNCVVGKESFREIADRYPLLIAGEDSIADALMSVARGTAAVVIK